MRLFRLLPTLFLAAAGTGCDGPAPSSSDGGVGDADDAGDGGESVLIGLPDPEDLLDPAVYDCRASATPPERVSALPLGCFADPLCPSLVVVAHRASRFFAPENTLSAVRSAIALGVDMVELDSRVTSDGEVVLLHDGEVDRTTDGTGAVSAMSLAEVRELSAVVGGVAPDDGDFSCDGVPTLREALELCRDRVDVMLDVKEGSVEAALVIDEMGMVEQVSMLASPTELEAAREAVPDLRVMVRPHASEEVVELWEAFGPSPDVVHIDSGFDDQDTIDVIHDLPAQVLLDMWPTDVEASFLGDYSGYAAAWARGIDIQQSEWPFFALWSVDRLDPP